jgi:hypothetical protein
MSPPPWLRVKIRGLVLYEAHLGAYFYFLSLRVSLLINGIFIRVIRTNKTHAHTHKSIPTLLKPLAGKVHSVSSADILPVCHSLSWPHQVPSGLSLLATQRSLCCHRN